MTRGILNNSNMLLDTCTFSCYPQDVEQVIELLRRIPSKYYLPIGVGCIGLILFVYGIGIFLTGNHQNEKMSFEKFSQASGSAVLGSESRENISVDVEGGVASPSVYHVPSQARVQDALTAAGGLSDDADRDFVAKHINLAAKLTDGAKIYIPRIGDVQNTDENSGNSGLVQDQNQQININSATSDELDSLPGVGPVTAQKIIAGRPYSSVDELQTRKIVSNSVYLKIKDSVVAY